MGLRQFCPYILTFEKQANAVRTTEILCIGQKLGQWRASPSGDDVEAMRCCIFHPPVFNKNRQIHPLGGGFQKFAFFAGGLE